MFSMGMPHPVFLQGDRERDVEVVKKKIEDEKAELQSTMNRDR